ncbi:50S ribosomal protein L35, partial [Dysosmobacter welbionis]
ALRGCCSRSSRTMRRCGDGRDRRLLGAPVFQPLSSHNCSLSGGSPPQQSPAECRPPPSALRDRPSA